MLLLFHEKIALKILVLDSLEISSTMFAIS